MKSYSPREVIKILKQNGWCLNRVTGDHYIFRKDKIVNIVVVPISKNNIKIGTLKNIERKSGIKFK